MLVSLSKRFIYAKTMRTASTTVEVFFEPYCMPEGAWSSTLFRKVHVSDAGIVGYRGVHYPFYRWRHRWYDHMSAAAIKKRLGSPRWEDYFKFCVIRNPFDRIVSAYHFFHGLKQRAASGSKLWNPDSVAESFQKWVRRKVVRQGIVDDRPCYTINGETCMDYFIRYESLESGLKHVCGELQIPFESNRPKKLVSGFRPSARPLSDYYDATTKDLVARHFRFELDEFGYDFPS